MSLVPSPSVSHKGKDPLRARQAELNDSEAIGRRSRWARVDDPFEFIRRLAKAAYDGDGEAQYRVAKEFDKCEMALSLVRKSNDPEVAIWELGAGWTQPMKEKALSEYQRCSRFMREDPFAELPRRPGGYTYQYWMERASVANYPLAMVEKAVGALMQPSMDSGARAGARQVLVHALLSGNPDALLLMGFNGFQSEDRERQIKAAAWMLAGCSAGADCGFDSAIYPFSMCHELECQPGMDVELVLRNALNQAEFAQAYARSQEIAEEIRNRNVEAIERRLGF